MAWMGAILNVRQSLLCIGSQGKKKDIRTMGAFCPNKNLMQSIIPPIPDACKSIRGKKLALRHRSSL
jgi:hypothetical protein